MEGGAVKPRRIDQNQHISRALGPFTLESLNQNVVF
jgi:hypothetical protein